MSTFAMVLAEVGGAVDHGSKTAFYIGGGVLAAWAVLVSFVGITRPSFPGTAAVARATMLLSVVFVAGALVTSIMTSA
jgi:hypothetical protein